MQQYVITSKNKMCFFGVGMFKKSAANDISLIFSPVYFKSKNISEYIGSLHILDLLFSCTSKHLYYTLYK